MKKYAIILFVFIVSWVFSQNIQIQIQPLSNNEYTISLKGKISPQEKWFIFSNDSTNIYASRIEVLNEQATLLSIDNTSLFVKEEQDNTLQSVVKYFSDSISSVLHIKYNGHDESIKLKITAFLNKKGNYESKEIELREIIPSIQTNNSESTNLGSLQNDQMSMILLFVLAFLGGLLAVLTPCVYSMLPITVSFFIKKSPNKKAALRNALLYALSIIGIFTLLGFLITFLFGPEALNVLATNWIANLFFFALFIVFGVSFLGAFNITLPSTWGNLSSNKSSIGSFSGIFFMALTLVIVSFSCTGPIIGNLIVLAAKGNYLGPLLGMFGFSLALSLPFFIFAVMPGWLNKISKSGGWLNVIKVSMGFIELALALKFLSNADLARGWRLLDREVFLALWIVIFILWGLYLLGFIRFNHDDELPKNEFGAKFISITRLSFAIISLSFAMYLVPGMWGAPLKSVAAFLPPMGTQDFILTNNSQATNTSTNNMLPHPKKYYEKMHIYEPEVVKKFGLITYFDYNESLEISKQVNRPVMIDFTGVNCVNCRAMEAKVWSNPEVMRILKDSFVIASLFIDVHHIDIPVSEQYTNSDGRKIITLGEFNTDFQIKEFNANVQPYYFFVNGDGKRLLEDGYGYNDNVNKFINHLRKVLAIYHKK